MIYLLLSILSSTFIVLTMKLFVRFNINNLHAIITNYFVAAALGLFVGKDAFDLDRILSGDEPWVWFALGLGVIFIVMFNIMSLSAQKVGISVTAIANNMSMVIPVTAAVLLYNDTLPWLKIVGILLAIVGLYLATKRSGGQTTDRKYLWLPLALFFGSGIIHTTINYNEVHYLPGDQSLIFIPTIFAIAGMIGFIFALPGMIRNRQFPSGSSLLGGMILGIFNYGSIYFLVLALRMDTLQDSEIFPINNMGIVALSTVLALIFFKERLSTMNWTGIIVSIIAIALIAFHHNLIPA